MRASRHALPAAEIPWQKTPAARALGKFLGLAVALACCAAPAADAIALGEKGAGRRAQEAQQPKLRADEKPRAEGKPSPDEAAARRREAFEIVWGAVKEHHFDPAYGGVDWDAVRAEFAPRAARAGSDRELHQLLQQMLNRLGKSHFEIIPPEMIATLGAEGAPGDGGDGEEEGADHTPSRPPTQGELLTEQMTHGIGLDLRIIDRAAVVTRVEAGSPAARAGLRTGFVLRAIDGWPVRSLLRWLREEALTQPSLRHQFSAELVLGRLNGPPQTDVEITYLDALNRVRRASVRRERLKGEMSRPSPVFPPQFVEFESRRLRGGVGYVRFNLFEPTVVGKFCEAMRGMSDAPGIVIDLRGNRGGLMGALYGMAGIVGTYSPILGRDSPTLGSMRSRAGQADIPVFPQKNSYKGHVAILIDAESQSASEMFASSLKELGRAFVVGRRSAGATLPSVVKELPTGAILQYAIADFITPFGLTLEGLGVEPDVSVRLDRRSLLAGRDPQLETALGLILRGGFKRPVISEMVTVNAPPPPAVSVVIAKDGDNEVDDGGPKKSPEELRAAKEVVAAAERRAEEIVEQYVAAVGGREAFEKISSRVSKGTFEGASVGVSVGGTVEIVEKSPGKALSVVSVPGVGDVRRAYTGEYGYEQIPLAGSRRFEGEEADFVRLTSDFRWPVNLRRLYPRMRLLATLDLDGTQMHVVEARPEGGGDPVYLHFDTKTGLLLRRNATRYDDYREVDGVKLPFSIRDGGFTIKLAEVTHNVAIDDARFAEVKDCFTR